MKKDIEWLKREVDRHTELLYGEEVDYLGLKKVVDVDLAGELIDQFERSVIPEIPEYIADYIDFAKSDTTFDRVMYLVHTRDEWAKWEEVYDWIERNIEKFVRAWFDGFTVEEKKYLVEDKNHTLLCKIDGLYEQEVISTLEVISIIESTADDLPIGLLKFELTEQEIKDYDERYWAFAELVEGDLQ